MFTAIGISSEMGDDDGKKSSSPQQREFGRERLRRDELWGTPEPKNGIIKIKLHLFHHRHHSSKLQAATLKTDALEKDD
jgi:hypothetical protein